MTGPIARIILRYAAGGLVAWGIISPDLGGQLASDPDVLALIGVALAAGVEGAYWFARQRGWAT